MPENDYLIYDVTVSTLTPLHIGNGVDLLNQYDYAIHAKRTWRINEDALLDAQNVEDPRVAEQLGRTPPAQLLDPRDFRPESGFFRYVLQGTPRSTGEGAQLREQLKDAFDRPYLPGTSLKGALRTAIAWQAWGAAKLKPEIRKLGRNRKWAGQDYERDLLGKNPNHDLLRALHVSDSTPLEPDSLLLLNARVITRGGNLAAPIEMEALRPDTSLHLTLKLDLALFSEWARRGGLRLTGRQWLEQLSQVVQAHSLDHIKRELAWFKEIRSAVRIAQFYGQLAGARLGGNRFLVALGWGTGWEDKTFGSRLQQD
ncbi:MAG: type III-A CRISPR-associated RAMP protein Csm5, partial [Caldilineae bacterium]